MPVPYRYTLYKLAPRAGVPAWVLEGYETDRPPVEWVIRVLEYARLEASVSVSNG
jgi:hypothetical protein